MSKIIIDPLQVATLDLEELESNAYASGDAGLAALVARLIDAEARWANLIACANQFRVLKNDALHDLLREIDILDNEEFES